MATTTPNYGWPVPTSTDYVKDGATAIEALGDAIDATVFGLGQGLKLINTTAFSAQTSISINSVFSSTYANYKIIAVYTQSVSGAEARLRLRTSGTDNTNSNYQNMTQRLGENNTAYNFTGTLSYAPVNNGSGNQSTLSFDVTSPNLSAKTNLLGQTIGVMSTGSFNAAGTIGCKFDVDTVFDGISLIFASGTGTGTIRVYGYKD